MRHTLVTGGSGFIGQHLVPALQARGRSVRILDLRSPALPRPARILNGSVLDPAVVSDALDDVDEVYHLAGLPGMWMPDKDDFHAVNCRGTEIVLAAARKRGVARFLHCSTESILFGPSNAERGHRERAHDAGRNARDIYAFENAGGATGVGGRGDRFPVVIANPTMPIGPHPNLTPPTAMLRHFLDGVFNSIRFRSEPGRCARRRRRPAAGHGAGQVGQRYILGGENLAWQTHWHGGALSGRNAMRSATGGICAHAAAAMDLMADHVTRRPPSATVEGMRIAVHSRPLSNEKSHRELGYAPRSIEPALREIVGSAVGSRAIVWGGSVIQKRILTTVRLATVGRPVQQASHVGQSVRIPRDHLGPLAGSWVAASFWSGRTQSGSAPGIRGPIARR